MERKASERMREGEPSTHLSAEANAAVRDRSMGLSWLETRGKLSLLSIWKRKTRETDRNTFEKKRKANEMIAKEK